MGRIAFGGRIYGHVGRIVFLIFYIITVPIITPKAVLPPKAILPILLNKIERGEVLKTFVRHL